MTWPPPVGKVHHRAEPHRNQDLGGRKAAQPGGAEEEICSRYRGERHKNPTRILQAEGKPSTTGFLYYEAAEAGKKSYVAITERLSFFFLF